MEDMEALLTVPVGKICFSVKEEPMGNDISELVEHVQYACSSSGNPAKKIDYAKLFHVTHHYYLN